MFKKFLSAKFTTDVAWLAGGQIIVALTGLLGLRVLTELVSPEVFAEANLILGMIGLGTHFLISPIIQTQVRFHPRFVKTQQLGIFLRIILCLNLLSALLLCLIIAIVFGFDLLGKGPKLNLILALILSGYILLSSIRGVFKNALNAERRQNLYSSWAALDAIFILIFVSILIWRNPTTDSFLMGYLVAVTVTLAIFLSLGAWKLLSRHKDTLGEIDVKRIVKSIYKFGWPFVIFAVLTWLSNLFDRYVLAAYIDLKTVGQYIALFAIGSKLPMLPALVFNEAFRPVVYTAAENNDAKKWKRLVLWWFFIISGSGLAMIIFVSVFGQSLANILLAEDYRGGAAKVLLIVTCGYTALSISAAVELMTLSRSNSTQLLAPKIIAAGATILMCFAFIPSLSSIGAAYANAGGQLVLLAGSLIVFKKSTKRPLSPQQT